MRGAAAPTAIALLALLALVAGSPAPRAAPGRLANLFAGLGARRGAGGRDVSAAGAARFLARRRVAGTRCLDGTAAGYYFAAGAPGADTLVINLQGGGACSSAEDCARRARGPLGSSRRWPPIVAAEVEALLSADPISNPDFYGAHKVLVPYCTGDLHSGTRAAAGEDTFGFYFGGARNFDAIVRAVRRALPRPPRYVLLNGQSAGAIGANRNVDRLHAIFPDAAVKAVPNSGWYFPERSTAPRYRGDLMPTWASFASGGADSLIDSGEGAWSTNVWGIDFGDCGAEQEDPGICISQTVNHAYTRSPVFVLGYLFDSQELVRQQGLPETALTGDANEATAETAAQYLREHGRSVIGSIGGSVKDGDAFFLSACLKHVLPRSQRVDGRAWVPLVGDWFFNRTTGEDIRVVDSCFVEGGLPCGDCRY